MNTEADPISKFLNVCGSYFNALILDLLHYLGYKKKTVSCITRLFLTYANDVVLQKSGFLCGMGVD